MTHPVHPEDPSLRRQLRRALESAGHTDSTALEDRVLAQWRLRHAPAGAVVASAGGAALQAQGLGWRPLWQISGALLLAALLFSVASWQRPDPVLEELMQLDVLSEMALGEM